MFSAGLGFCLILPACNTHQDRLQGARNEIHAFPGPQGKPKRVPVGHEQHTSHAAIPNASLRPPITTRISYHIKSPKARKLRISRKRGPCLKPLDFKRTRARREACIEDAHEGHHHTLEVSNSLLPVSSGSLSPGSHLMRSRGLQVIISYTGYSKGSNKGYFRG